MGHLLLKAAITAATDEGTFEAVISTGRPDREGDIVRPSAMAAALGKWATLGKLMPLAWVHADGRGNEDVIGNVDPASARVENDEVIVKGQVDRELERGKEAWRLIKSGTVSFSFGYLIPEGGATKRTGGRLDIKELDVFEISIVPIAPANNDTRVIGWKFLETHDRVITELQGLRERVETLEKSLQAVEEKAEEAGKETKSRSVDPLRKQAESLELEFSSDGLSLRKPPRKVEQPRLEPELALPELKARMRDEIVRHLSGEPLT